MIDFGLLILAHMIGDFVFQNDWMAKNKTSSSFVCLVHVLCYTLAFVLIVEFSAYFSGGVGWPFWAYALIGITHYPIDRYGLARKYMNLNGQKDFADNMGPWSIIVVDNTLHLLCAWLIAIGVTLTV